MRISIDHHTRYRFSEPQARIVQMLRLTPVDTRDQTIVSWHVGVDCDARLRPAVDGYGNAITMLYAEGPIDAIDITVTGEVLTTNGNGVVAGSAEPLPPALFLRKTPRTVASDALFAFAVDNVTNSRSPLDLLHRLNDAFFRRFPDAPDLPDTGASAADAFETRKPTSRDLAQMFIASARMLGTPARYVTGYLSDGEAHSAPHGWAEAHIEEIGWIGFDPTRGLSPDERYVRVAVGLDTAGAAATAGTRIGHGREELAVDVQATSEA